MDFKKITEEDSLHDHLEENSAIEILNKIKYTTIIDEKSLNDEDVLIIVDSSPEKKVKLLIFSK